MMFETGFSILIYDSNFNSDFWFQFSSKDQESVAFDHLFSDVIPEIQKRIGHKAPWL